jgi:hypothetical protein
MRSQKGSRKIVIGAVAYRWRATGKDDYISIGIWPANNIGPYIQGNFRYHERWIENGDGSWSSAGNQIVITNRIIRRIIEHAIAIHGYDPQVVGAELNLRVLDDVVKRDDVVRGGVR